MVFDHVDDYKSFLLENLNQNELISVRDLLNRRLDRFVTAKKERSKSLKCLNETFLSFKKQMIDSFEFHFLNKTIAKKHLK